MTFGKTAKWMSALSLSLILAACGGGGESEGASGSDFDTSQDIHVITREEGSGTRGAFTEITGVLDENEEDATTPTATVQNSTNAVMQAVEGDESAIGYISLGSLNDSVKGLNVEGVEPTAENVQSGDYQVARNFNVTYGQELSDVAQDFYDFMFSSQAQSLVEEEGYVPVETDAPEYEAQAMSGDISVVGSTSVEPLMTRFTEAYGEYNPDVTIDVTSPGSGAGITAAIDGSADIGMSSRDLTEEETSEVQGVDSIAVDGIAVIANEANPVADLTLDQISGIYLGDITTWDEVVE